MTKSRRQVNMKACAKEANRWALILSKLREAQSFQMHDVLTPAVVGRSYAAGAGPRSDHARKQTETRSVLPLSPYAKIYVLDRTERAATITWHDPTACHYDDQRWYRCTASHKGVCAITGALIVRGADIFRPARARSMPVNSDAMILASALPAVSGVDAV
jgi:hypothetical protein